MINHGRQSWLLLNLLLLFPVLGIAQGVAWQNLSWFAAQNQSVNQNQLLFVDVYTDWCAPCKWNE